MSVDAAEINGAPGTLISAGGHPVAVLTMAVADGRITAIQLLTNPDKLQRDRQRPHVAQVSPVARGTRVFTAWVVTRW